MRAGTAVPLEVTLSEALSCYMSRPVTTVVIDNRAPCQDFAARCHWFHFRVPKGTVYW
jgi:hypothetical protein